jgi:hypothetical protein
MYKLCPLNLQGKQDMVQRLSDNAFIPFVEDNADYKEYLKWVAEGNTPQPADE